MQPTNNKKFFMKAPPSTEGFNKQFAKNEHGFQQYI